MLENVTPLLKWFDALERRIRILEVEVNELQGDRLMREVDVVIASAARPVAKALPSIGASKPPRTVGLSNIPQVRKRGRPARA